MTACLNLDRELRLSMKQYLFREFRAPCPACDAPIKREDQVAIEVGIRCPKCGYTGGPKIEIAGAIGEYGGGKTFIHMDRVLDVCLDNPFIHGVHAGGSEPLTGLVAPTLGDMKKSTLVEFMKVCPDDLIYQMRLYGEYQDIQLVNGHRILLYSAEGACNGPTLVQLGLDEVQDKIYDGKLTNYQGRVRDKRARRLSFTASGIAERGHVEELYRRPAPANNRMHVMLYPEDNKRNLALGYTEELKASQPASRERDGDGWLLVKGAMFPKFARMRNVRLPPGLEDVTLEEIRRIPVSFAVDFGRKAAVVIGVPIRRARVGGPWELGDVESDEARRYRVGLLIVDELMLDNIQLADHMVKLIKARCALMGWRVSRERSVMCFDPTIEDDQVLAFITDGEGNSDKAGFPGVRVIIHPRGFYHLEANGIRAVDRAVLDLNEDIRLFIHPRLLEDPSGRGVIAMFGGYQADKPKDKKYEHASDVVRYLTQHIVPIFEPTKAPEDPQAVTRISAAEKEPAEDAAGINERFL